MLTVKQVAQRLGIQPGAVRDAIARGRLVAIPTDGTEKKAGHLLVMKDELERYEREVAGKHGPKKVSKQGVRKTKPRKPATPPADHEGNTP